jgi:RNA polymerase sigma-70 factor (ECF subfamily)
MEDLDSLFQRARAGDVQALEDLIAQLRHRVHQQAQERFGPHPRARLDASDIAQEVSLRVHRQFDQLKGQTFPQLLAWVEEIFLNYLADCHKYNGAARRDARRQVAGDNLFPDLAADTALPSQRLLHAEEKARLEQALHRLPEQQRLVFQLRFIEQLPFKEVAQRAGVSAGNARVLFLRATEKLRKELGEHP